MSSSMTATTVVETQKNPFSELHSSTTSSASSTPRTATAANSAATQESTPSNSDSSKQSPADKLGSNNNTSPSGGTVCHNCATTNTPLWRRDESGSVLCNACGLFLKLHGIPRPIHLKTDTIKSRNRMKGSGANNSDDKPHGGVSKKKSTSSRSKSSSHSHQQQQKQPQSQPQPQTQTQSQSQPQPQQQQQQQQPSTNNQRKEVPVPISPMPSYTHAQTHAPSLQSLPPVHHQFAHNAPPTPPPSTVPMPPSISAVRKVSAPLLDQLSTAAFTVSDSRNERNDKTEIQSLKTRITELEVVNDLYKTRMSQLEKYNEQLLQTIDQYKAKN